jgi:tetratricopeptide (TPR) repeat protein
MVLIDGVVDLTGAERTETFQGGEQGVVTPGQPPRKSPLLNAVGAIQWALHYPAVVDVEELGLTAAELEQLSGSVAAYRAGDLLGALEAYPENRAPGSGAERVFRAALLLAAGLVEPAEAALREPALPDGGPARAAQALRDLIAVVRGEAAAAAAVGALSKSDPGVSGLMARSYAAQARSDLGAARAAARSATERAPQFGAAWIRLAELEFGFGRAAEALTALERGLERSPRHAAGVALRGFLLAAQQRDAEALSAFGEAVALDPGFSHAWLGRGLMKIRMGDGAGGRADLQVAAALEPQRAVLRSYLGKAFSHTKDLPRAEKELALARKLDPADPTGWLYSALLNEQQNRVNAAVRDLEKSKALNENRSVFRSRLLLDQDQAVRSANLAAIYRDAGMTEVSVQEASRAVNRDYANASAHLFLANSYDALRDPKLINLRYETPAFSERLVSHLLAPPGAGSLSPNVSQQEYSRLFDGDRFGLFSSTEYSSGGDWVQRGSHDGVFGNSSYSFDAYYRSENGQRPNNDLEQLDLTLRFKQQVTEKDSVLFQVSRFDSESGDVAQYYNQGRNLSGIPAPSLALRVTETQEPNLFVGYHREWAPGSHTLFLFSRIDDTLEINDSAPSLLWLRTAVPPLGGATNVSLRNAAFYTQDYQSDLAANSAELQQIWENHQFTFIVGGRHQWADASTKDDINRTLGLPVQVLSNNDTDLSRESVYGYAHWQATDSLRLIGGLSYDHLEYPVNIDTSPISSAEDSKSLVSPKAGILYTPLPKTHLRAAYARSLGGVFFDNSVRLEPTQIAGFTSAYRSLIPESVQGLVPGTEFDIYGVGLDHTFDTRTYLYLQGELLKSDGTRTIGLLVNSDPLVPIADTASSTRQSLEFEEKSLSFGLNQLLGQEIALGSRYKVTHADLQTRSLDIAPTVTGAGVLNQDVESLMHQVWLYAIYQHRCGFFSQLDAVWSKQSNDGYTPSLPGENLWQFNASAGYRFLQRRAEIRVGLLNITDEDYHLNPLTVYREMPRDRTLAVSLKLEF